MILDAFIVFVAQFVYVLLLGLQSLNVNGGHRTAAAATSLTLGVFGFYLTGSIAAAKGDIGGVVWWAFILSGPCGIVTSMALFSKWRGGK